ncbi:MAG: hypothetical protein HY912_13410 [Desulfomonile tiedjei]|uniref:Uncharacterized protein n=1 Tax=Desulfomonile tiedjei TaxID=2358 RepID=A0A9D6Z428_9BACT|nr:hypothetical protein [Desulfomonile tiedjei]
MTLQNTLVFRHCQYNYHLVICKSRKLGAPRALFVAISARFRIVNRLINQEALVMGGAAFLTFGVMDKNLLD